MKGYYIDTGYMGYIPNMGYILFSCEADYVDYYIEHMKSA